MELHLDDAGLANDLPRPEHAGDGVQDVPFRPVQFRDDDLPTALERAAGWLRQVQQWLGEPVDVRRLRPNLVLDVPGEGFVEDAWAGRELRVGDEVVLAVGDGMQRCAMVNAAQIDLDHDARLLKLISKEHDLDLGLQVSVVRTGTIAVGDPVHLV